MGAPQYIILALTFLGIGISLAKFDEPKGKYGFIDLLFGPAITLGLLYWGGFFN